MHRNTKLHGVAIPHELLWLAVVSMCDPGWQLTLADTFLSQKRCVYLSLSLSFTANANAASVFLPLSMHVGVAVAKLMDGINQMFSFHLQQGLGG